MARQQNFITMGKEAQAAPTVNPGAVNFGVQATPLVKAPTLDLSTLSQASAFFVRDAMSAANDLNSAALARQRKETAEFEEKMAEQGQADALRGSVDPEANTFAAYAHAFKTVKGANTGRAALGQFLETAARDMPPDADPVEYARQWAAANPFTIGDDKFDANALGQFDQGVQRWGLDQRAQRIKSATNEGVMEVERSVGGMVVGMELTPEGLQTAIAQARALMPHDPTSAAKMVVAAATKAALTPEQQAHVMSVLSTPGSFAPGVSFAQQFPAAFQAQEQQFNRQRTDNSRWRLTEAYDGLDNVIDEMNETGDLSKATDVLTQLNRTRDEFGDGPRYRQAVKKLEKAIGKVAAGIATTNSLEAGITNNSLRTPDLFESWRKNGDDFMAKQGYDPLSPAPLPNGVPSYIRAAQAVVAYGSIPTNASTMVTQALLNGEDPARQAAAFRFIKAIEAARGETVALAMIPEHARPLYQSATGGIAKNGDAEAWFRTFGSPNEKREDDSLTLQRVTGTDTAAKARKAATEAVTSALTDHLGFGGWFSSGVTISPEVHDRMVDDLKRSSVQAARVGNLDLGQLSKDVVKRLETNVQVVPGEGGKAVAVWSGPPPASATGATVRLGRRVMNPTTGEVEDTTATAEKDLGALSTAMPTVAGSRDRLALYAPPPSSPQGLLYQRYGVLPVTREGQPIVLRAGDSLGAAAASVPSPAPASLALAGRGMGLPAPPQRGGVAAQPAQPDVKLSADPVEAARQFKARFPNVPFKLLPISVVDPVTKQPTFIYQMTYAPRFAVDPATTPAAREAARPAAQAAAAADDAADRDTSANRPQLWTPAEEDAVRQRRAPR